MNASVAALARVPARLSLMNPDFSLSDWTNNWGTLNRTCAILRAILWLIPAFRYIHQAVACPRL
jgi:hypothetical protein